MDPSASHVFSQGTHDASRLTWVSPAWAAFSQLPSLGSLHLTFYGIDNYYNNHNFFHLYFKKIQELPQCSDPLRKRQRTDCSDTSRATPRCAFVIGKNLFEDEVEALCQRSPKGTTDNNNYTIGFQSFWNNDNKIRNDTGSALAGFQCRAPSNHWVEAPLQGDNK